MTNKAIESLNVSQYDSDDDLFLPNSMVERQEHLPKWSPRLNQQSFESMSSENEGLAWDSVPVCQLDHTNRGSSYRSLEHQDSIVDGLLEEIYDRWQGNRRDSFDSDTFTECSSTSEVFHRGDIYNNWSTERKHNPQLHRTYLQNQNLLKLFKMRDDLKRSNNQMSVRLVRQLKRRDRRLAKLQRNCDIVTAIIQATSLKRRIDTRMRFSIEPLQSDNAFDQWKDAMKAVARLPMGIPGDFRKKVWLSLADDHIKDLRIDWEKTVRFAFNEKSNPDDNKLGLQIVKDLHRTGCTSFSGHDNDEDRAVLKRVLLAYARWNKRVGYCQGFNIIAALLLDVMDRKEDDALKVMVYLIDHVLPESYFANNLRALSVDMAVFRDLLHMTLPSLAKHLDYLQHAAQDHNTGACYEPPLTNVFTMQWFLTLFATCLPKNIVLRVLDSVLLEGSEILLRTALTIWGKLARRIMNVPSADEFYSLMGDLSAEMMQGHLFNADSFIKSIYSIAVFPFPNLMDLREKYTYNIRPFTNTANSCKKSSETAKNVLYSDDDELDEDDIEAISCFPGMEEQPNGTGADISSVGPGAFGASIDSSGHRSPYMERMSTDIHALKKQYERLRHRQRQAHIIIAGASVRKTPKPKAVIFVPKIETPTAMNHLFIGKLPSGGKNCIIADGPSIAPMSTRSSLLSKQVYAAAMAENNHRKHSLRNSSVNSNSDTISSEASVETIQDREENSLNTEESNDDSDHLNENNGKSVFSRSLPDCSNEFDDSISAETTKDWSSVSLHTVMEDHSRNNKQEPIHETSSGHINLKGENCKNGTNTKNLSSNKDSQEENSNPIQSVSSPDISNIAVTNSDIPYRKSKHTMMLQSLSRSVSLVEGDHFLTKFSCLSTPARQNSAQGSNLSVSPGASQPTTPTSDSESLSKKSSKPFNPFPTKHINQNRTKTGLKLGLYRASTVQLTYKNKQKPLS